MYYLNITSGSLSELLTHLEISKRLNCISHERKVELELRGIRIAKMLYMLIKKIESRLKE